jgi:glutathione synthase/RimK-type ligase-like ATP-grasp enzyme
VRAWILFPIEPPTDDRAYLLGHLMAIFDRLTISRVGMFDERAPEAPDGIDLIIGWTRTRNRRILDHLDEMAGELGIPISNPAGPMWRAIDKRCYLEDYLEFIPRTLIADDMTELRRAWDALGGDVVVKDPFGDRGQEVERVRSKADFALAERLLAASPSGEVVVQEYCAGFAKGDKRILMHRAAEGGWEIIGQFRRIPPAGEWKSNLRHGGRAERCELTDEEIRLAHRVAEISGLDYIGLDVGEHEGRNLLIETNQAPGGLIDYDLDRGARGIEKVGRFLRHLAVHGRHEGVGLSHRESAPAEASRSARGDGSSSAGG